MTPDYLQLKQRFHQLCFSLTPLEWRLIRNPDYWLSDYMSPEQSLMHKYERVMYYKTNRTVKPYSPQQVKELHDEFNRKIKKSII